MNFLYQLAGIATAIAEDAAAGSEVLSDAEALAEVNPIVSIITTLLPMVLIFVVFYFMLIRPQQKKDKQVKEMLNNLKVSDRVCTIGGIYGTITQIKDDTITLSVGNQNMTMVVARWGIRSVEEVSIENDTESLN
ncbi:MAG: preprotein translocase subunit YajC [Clostridia bacterium]|nr:preprotein translocase subunit YajC [Clostridia bacterium]